MKNRPGYVTITGADDSTDIYHLMYLSGRFPFVEWGILVSSSRTGSPRFPGLSWMEDFTKAVAKVGILNVNVSVHLCGGPVRKLLQGDLQWSEIPGVLEVAGRVQINTHAEPSRAGGRMVANLAELPGRQFIFQRDLVNDGLVFVPKAWPEYRIDVAALFDTSGGGGVLPEAWP